MASNDPIDTGWRIHSALTDWTGKVDAKASFALTLESALLVGVITLSGNGRALANLSGWPFTFYVVGISLLVLAVVSAGWVVRPRLRWLKLKSEAPSNYIYFGHLRLLSAGEVEDKLNDNDITPVLSKQLVEMSKIAWKKHRAVQLSLTLAPLGVLCLGASALWG